jgi:predicted secreted protein
MKIRLVILGMIAALALSVLACSAGAKEKSIEVSTDEFASQDDISQQVEVAVGGSLKVTLGSLNMGGSVHWSEAAQISDSAVLKQTGYEFLTPINDIPGNPDKEVWTFTALTQGDATISMVFAQPWRSDWRGGWSYTLEVNVE